MWTRRGSFNALLITTCHSIYIQVLKRLLVRSFYKSKYFFVRLIRILEELVAQTNLLVVDLCTFTRLWGINRREDLQNAHNMQKFTYID